MIAAPLSTTASPIRPWTASRRWPSRNAAAIPATVDARGGADEPPVDERDTRRPAARATAGAANGQRRRPSSGSTRSAAAGTANHGDGRVASSPQGDLERARERRDDDQQVESVAARERPEAAHAAERTARARAPPPTKVRDEIGRWAERRTRPAGDDARGRPVRSVGAIDPTDREDGPRWHIAAPLPTAHRAAAAPVGVSDLPQYSLAEDRCRLGRGGAADGVPGLGGSRPGSPTASTARAPLAQALLLCLTAGLIWQFVLVVVLVAREQRSLRWSRVRPALWLQAPRSPRTGRRGGRLWLLLIPLLVGFAAEEFVPQIQQAAAGHDLPAFLDSHAGHVFLSRRLGLVRRHRRAGRLQHRARRGAPVPRACSCRA